MRLIIIPLFLNIIIAPLSFAVAIPEPNAEAIPEPNADPMDISIEVIQMVGGAAGEEVPMPEESGEVPVPEESGDSAPMTTETPATTESGPCVPDIDMVQVGDEWFKVFNGSDEDVTWDEAHANCSAMNLKLAEPQDPEALLNHLAENYAMLQLWWYGAKAEGVNTFHWSSTGEDINYTNDDFLENWKLGPRENCNALSSAHGECCLLSGSPGRGLFGANGCWYTSSYICQCL